MTEIWLNFIDEDGYPKRVLVGRDNFVIGRHPDNDLCIPDKRLSRQHLQIERFGEKITVSDCGSSNGTTLNNEDLFESETLRNGDILNLGGVEVRVEIFSARREEHISQNYNREEVAPPIIENRATKNVSGVPDSFGGISSNFLFIAPAIGLLFLLIGGGIFLALREDSNENPKDDVVVSNEREEINRPRENRKTPSGDKTPAPAPVNSGENSNSTPTPTNNGTIATPIISSELEKVKVNATEFMKRIARNDSNPFLRAEQAEKVNQKIKNFRNSSSLAENLRAVLRDKSQFESLASSQNLKPQFLAAAALNEIGNRSGNPAETAKTMLPILGKLKIPLDNNFADDNFLIIADYDQGKQGDFRSLQGKMEGLSKTLSKKGESVTPRQLRTIWFLKEKDKLTDAQFEYALNFLAVGVIMQNPKDFGVNAEPVVF